MIAPTFESLSTKYSKPNKITFCKVDVDSQQEVAQQYSVRAMPTFLVLHNGSVIDTIQGANPPALTAAVEKGVKLAGAAAGAVFSSGGHRLGGAGVGPRQAGGIGAGVGTAIAKARNWSLAGMIHWIVAFFGLYFTSLFTVSSHSEQIFETWTYTARSWTRIKLRRTQCTTSRALRRSSRPDQLQARVAEPDQLSRPCQISVTEGAWIHGCVVSGWSCRSWGEQATGSTRFTVTIARLKPPLCSPFPSSTLGSQYRPSKYLGNT